MVLRNLIVLNKKEEIILQKKKKPKQMIMKFQVMRDIAAGSHHARALSSRHILVMCAMSRRSLLLKFINRFLF